MASWELISLESAKNLATESMRALRFRTETVGLREALGRIAAADVINEEDNPAFDRSTVDGYALHSADVTGASPETPASLIVTGEVRMGKPAAINVETGQAARIPTGGMLPAGADAVVMQEWTCWAEDGTLLVTRAVKPGENSVSRGSDMLAGTLVLKSGSRISVPDIGVLASCGIVRLDVVKKPVVTVVATGDEIIPSNAVPEPGQIRDVNSFTLSALSEMAGCEVRPIKRVPDSLDTLQEVLKTALTESDAVLISGGSSVGDRDYTTKAVQLLPEVKILFHGIALKPGKPTLMALAGKTAVFGIPGHTVAAMTVFRELVEPALAAFQGVTHTVPHFMIHAILGTPLCPDKNRAEIFRVRLDQREGQFIAWPLPAQSGLITSMSRAHGLIYARAGQKEIPAGEMVEVEVLIDRASGIWRGGLR